MVPVASFWISNFNGPAIRWKIVFLSSNKDKCDEAHSMLKQLSSNPKYLYDLKPIVINSTEQLKLLNALSIDIEDIYFKVSLLLNI